MKQNNRPLDEFLTEAKLLIQNSGYPTDIHDELLRDALVFGVDSDIVRKKCIAEGNKLTLQKAREIARTEEANKMQLEATTNHNQIYLLNKKDFSKGKTQPQNKPSKGQKRHKGKEHRQTDKPKPECGRCGGRPHDKLQKCPAINSKCYNCHKGGHYQRMCFKTKPSGVNTLQGESSDPGESDLDERVFLGTLTAERCSDTNDCTGEIDNIQSHQDRTKALIEMQLTAKPTHRHTTPIVCKLDTGTEMNVISMQDYEKVVKDPRQRQRGPPLMEDTI